MSAPRLLAGVGPEPIDYERHRRLHGPAARFHGAELRAQLETAGLRGRGGGAFPLARKLDALARRRGSPVLVANGCEGEPMSGKDRVLLRSAPHLVIDGAIAVGDAIAAERIMLALDELDVRSHDAVDAALAERPAHDGSGRIEVVSVPPGYVTGQESALVNWCNRRGAIPTAASPRVTERGVGGRPTAVNNAETLAHAALIAHHGARWFRETGTEDDPGTALITLHGAVAAPGVYEMEHGAPLTELMADAGGPTARVAAVLLGGYSGGWVGADRLGSLRLDRATLQRAGVRLGAGIVVLLPVDACPVSETAGVADWMALQSAGQCGPCVYGLAAIADALEEVRRGEDGRRALADVVRWCAQVSGRGACAHPDGLVGFVASALRVFRGAFLDHAEHGPCEHCEAPGILRTPGLTSGARA